MNWEIGLSIIPAHMREGVRRYIESGIPGGGFMTAVFENKLVQAFGKADHMNEKAMKDWAEFLYNYAPSLCWGSPEKVAEWQQRGGLKGITNV